MATFISNSPSETELFAVSMAQHIAQGTVLGLIGDLGAGKTQFVKGFARGMGITESVLSPTYTLVQIYGEGNVKLFHIDLYRLESSDAIQAAGLEEYFHPQGITLVEWWDHWRGTAPASLRVITLEALSENRRKITYAPAGT